MNVKKRLLLLFCCGLFLACGKDEDRKPSVKEAVTKKFCWNCLITVRTSVSPSVQGYPQTVKTDQGYCDLTENQIKDVIKASESTTKSSAGGFTATVKVTMNCSKK